MIGQSSMKVLLALINAYYDEKNGFAHCSVYELNAKYGIALKNIPKMFKKLEEDKWIEDCTINGYYKRFKIIKKYPCPDFILDNRLNTPQKNFLLKCIDNNINENMSKKEICRILNNNENLSNLNTIVNKIAKSTGKTLFDILNFYSIIEGEIPENAIYTEYGYRTNNEIRTNKSKNKEDIVANLLYKKSFEGYKKRKNVREYSITPEIISTQLLKQDFKDYYTGLVPNNIEDYSLDRIDSSKGYTEDNIVITTNIVNIMKSDLTIDEFKEMIKLTYYNINNF